MKVNTVSLMSTNNSVNFAGRREKCSDCSPRQAEPMVKLPLSYLRAIALGAALVTGGVGVLGTTGCGGGAVVTKPTDPVTPPVNPAITPSQKAVANMFDVLGLLSTTTAKSSMMRANAMTVTSAATTSVASGVVTDFSYHDGEYYETLKFSLNRDLSDSTKTVYDGTITGDDDHTPTAIRRTYTVDENGNIFVKEQQGRTIDTLMPFPYTAKNVVDADRHMVYETIVEKPNDPTVTYMPLSSDSILGEYSNGGSFRYTNYSLTVAK